MPTCAQEFDIAGVACQFLHHTVKVTCPRCPSTMRVTGKNQAEIEERVHAWQRGHAKFPYGEGDWCDPQQEA